MMSTLEMEAPTPSGPPIQRAWKLSPDEWRTLATVSVTALAPLPWLALHAQELSRRPHYQLYPLVIPGALALAWHALREPAPNVPNGLNPRRSSGIALFGLCVLMVGVLFISPWLATVAALINLLAIIDAVGGWRLVRRLLPAWGFLCLALPPPRGPDEKLLLLLQSIATRWSSAVLDGLGVIHVMEGNIIEVVGRKLFVEQACSGINSLFTLVLGTLFIAAWTHSRLSRALLLVVASVGWVLVGNVLRIVTIAAVDSRWHIDLSSGWKHTALGMILFAMMLGLVFSTDRLIRIVVQLVGQEVASILAFPVRRWKWLSRAEEDRSGAPVPVTGLAGDGIGKVPFATLLRDGLHAVRTSWLGSWPFATVFAFVFCAQISFLWRNQRDFLRSEETVLKSFETLAEGDMPARIGPFQRARFETLHRKDDTSWGEYSKSWQYAMQGAAASVSLDYTFLGWHELTDCYRGNAWEIEGYDVRYGPEGNVAAGSSTERGQAEVRLIHAAQGYGYLIYGLADYDSRPLAPPHAMGFVDRLVARLGNWSNPNNNLGVEAPLPTYQYQVFLQSQTPPTETEIREARLLFQKARDIFLARGPKRKGGTT